MTEIMASNVFSWGGRTAGGVAIATPLRGTRKGGRIGSDSLPFRGFLTEPAKGERIRADSTGCKKMANVAPERGPFLEGNLGGTKRHATVLISQTRSIYFFYSR